MMLTGYPIEDLSLRASFVDASRQAVEVLAQQLADEGLGALTVVVRYAGTSFVQPANARATVVVPSRRH